jgi:hypothetical protein
MGTPRASERSIGARRVDRALSPRGESAPSAAARESGSTVQDDRSNSAAREKAAANGDATTPAGDEKVPSETATPQANLPVAENPPAAQHPDQPTDSGDRVEDGAAKGPNSTPPRHDSAQPVPKAVQAARGSQALVTPQAEPEMLDGRMQRGRHSSRPPQSRQAMSSPRPDVVTNAGDEELLFVRQSPIIETETSGPRKIKVGVPADYKVTVNNAGDVVAEELLVTVRLPEWAEVVSAQPTSGSTRPPKAAPDADGLQWSLARLEPGGREELELRIIPRKSHG